MDRRIEFRPLDSIDEAARNPKLHDEQAITASMNRFGFLEPLIVDERTGRLVAGHGRRDELLRARAAGERPPEGVRVRKGVWEVPVTVGWASRDDDDAHAAGVALNRVGELGGWEPETLLGMLDGWDAGDPAALGFDRAGLDDLRALAEETAIDLGVFGDLGPPAGAIRAIILDYPLAEYEQVTATCRRLREARGLASNAELVEQLVGEAAE